MSKKKSPAFFFLMFFALVLVITIISSRKSVLVKEIDIPLNAGIASLSTYGQYLTVISNDNTAYLCSWNNLSDKYQAVSLKANQAVLLKSGFLLSVDAFNPRTIYAASVADKEKDNSFPISEDFQRAFINISRDQNTVMLVLGKAGIDSRKTDFVFNTIDPGTKEIQRKFNVTVDVDIDARINTALSDNGSLLAMCGGKNDAAWLALYSIRERKLLWEKQFPQPVLFFNCVFTFDSKFIFARGSDSTVYKLTTLTGDLAGQLLAVKENKSTLDNQSVQRVQVSFDGRFTAAIVSNIVYVWNDAGKKIFSRAPRHKLVSGIAFSPDGRYIATSDFRQGGKIKIWRLP